MGNSEVGHMNIGAGRVVDQDLIRLNKSLSNDGIKNKEDFIAAVEYATKNNSTFHLTGLYSDGGVHSHSDHLHLILDYLKKTSLSKICLHLFTDGRDCSPKDSYKQIAKLISYIDGSNISIASVSGRYYSMDRDNRWERIKLSYDAMVNGIGIKSRDILSSIKQKTKLEIRNISTCCIDSGIDFLLILMNLGIQVGRKINQKSIQEGIKK